MKKIHMEETVEKINKNHQTIRVPMHYFYLLDGGEKILLCKQRKYAGVERHFLRDLPVDAVYRHKWGRDKMVDNVMAKLPKCLSYVERWGYEYAA